MAKMTPGAPVRRGAQSEPAAPSAQAAPTADCATGLVAMGEYHYARSVVQRRASGQDEAAGQATPDVPEVPGTPAARSPAPVNRTGLPDGLKAGVEALSGVNLDDVRVHYRSAKPAQYQAHAYAQGRQIHLAAGEERHLPHEAWHVAQQAQGRVEPTRQLKSDISVNDDIELEREADRMGDAALRIGTTQGDASPIDAPRTSPPSPQTDVMQGVFLYDGKEIDDDETAKNLAKSLYDELSGSDAESALSIEDFTLAIEELALYGNHGELSLQYFKKLLDEGIVRETFSFERVGRRLETHIGDTANFPPRRSSFHGVLAERGRLKAKNKSAGTSAKKPSRKRKSTASDGTESENDKTDLSYTDLNALLAGALRTIGLLPKDQAEKIITDAVNAALAHFDATGNAVKLDARFNTDIQLIVHHLLRYQTFNHGPLQDRPQNRDENAFRAFLVEQTKEIIRKAANDLPSIVPPVPDLAEGGSLHDALPAPIDSNRALAHSSFTGEIYKGVFKLSQGLLRDAYDRARQQQARTSAPSSTSGSIQVSELRSHLNPAFFQTLEKDTSTVIPSGGGKTYVTEHANLHYDEDAESFDEASTDTDWDPPTDTELYASKDNLERANKKRKTILNTLGVFVKLENQKSALDKDKDGGPKKRARIRRGNDRRVAHLNRHYQERFAGIASETKFRADKISAIESRVARLRAEQAICDVLLGKTHRIDRGELKKISTKNPAYTMVTDFLKKTARLSKGKFSELQTEAVPLKKAIEIYVEKLDAGTRGLELKKQTLEEYYAKTPIGKILRRKSENPRGWRKENPAVFGGLGDKGLDELASGSGGGETLSVDPDEEEEEEKPQRKKRKRKAPTKASVKGKEKASDSDSDGSEADDEGASDNDD